VDAFRLLRAFLLEIVRIWTAALPILFLQIEKASNNWSYLILQ